MISRKNNWAGFGLVFWAGLTVLSAEPGFAQSADRQAQAPEGWEQTLVEVPVTNLGFGDVIPAILDQRDSLIADRYMQAFRFSATEGTPVEIEVVGSRDQRTSSNLSMVPYLLVFGPDNELIARTGVQPGTVLARVITQIPETGSYTILVSAIEPRKPGRFGVSLREVTQREIEGRTLPIVSDGGTAPSAVQSSSGSDIAN